MLNELFLTSSSAVVDEGTQTSANTSNLKLEILNGTGSTTKLNQALEQLKSQGYKITKQGNTNIANTTTIINRTKKTSSDENAIVSLLGTGTKISGEDNSEVDFTIILGKDY